MATTRRAAPRKSVAADSLTLSAEDTEPAPARSRGPVFISHDSRDADLAEAFSNLLTDVSAGILKSFRASDKKGATGIPFGTEWYQEIMTQLAGASDVVALLTSQSIERPWILYEAGVAKGKLNTTVFGVALGAPLHLVSTGPFAQFQNCGDDADSLTKLVMQLLSRNPDTAPREEAVKMQVDLFKQKVQEILEARGASIDGDSTSDAAKLFEEVKEMVRADPGSLA
jgi:TIR domain